MSGRKAQSCDRFYYSNRLGTFDIQYSGGALQWSLKLSDEVVSRSALPARFTATELVNKHKVDGGVQPHVERADYRFHSSIEKFTTKKNRQNPRRLSKGDLVQIQVQVFLGNGNVVFGQATCRITR